MKTSRRQPNNVVNMAPIDGAGANAPAAGVTEEQIAHRAYELYCERGCQDGHDLDDWLQAERDVRSHATSTAA
jgi:hypothetical protein